MESISQIVSLHTNSHQMTSTTSSHLRSLTGPARVMREITEISIAPSACGVSINAVLGLRCVQQNLQ